MIPRACLALTISIALSYSTRLALAADQVVIQDQAGQAEATITGIPSVAAPGSQDSDRGSRLAARGSSAPINIYRPDGTRAGYGVQRPDGSTDLFRPDGSRLGQIDSARPGQPGRITIQPGRRK